jgi:transmembrane protein 132
VLIASAEGSYENLHIQPLCAIITAVNERSLYETQACFISPATGYCLVTISVLKMIEYPTKNQTTNKIELYLKLHHVGSFNECISNHSPKQNHIHHETRIGHVEYIDNDNILFSTINHSSISIDYPTGIHYSNWYFPLKLKLILSSSSSLVSSFIIRCRLKSYFSIYSIQTNILKITNYFIQINHKIHPRSSLSDIDFNLTINQINKTNSNSLFEIDLATLLLSINSTNLHQNNSNSYLFIDWFILSNNSVHSHDPILQVPIYVQSDDIQTIVPITDFTSLINTAMLSMQIQQFPLKILAINYSGSIQSINQAVCHSENIYLIQVDSSCNHIYFSGHERDDFFDHVNSPASIVVRYEKYLQRLVFTIYIPERPLRIELSDTKLSRINGWFTTNRENNEQQARSESSTHALDDEDDEEDDDEDEDDEDDDDNHVKCYPVYQQSSIQVSTKFYRTTPSKI